jgi:hypothetical protein
MAEMACPDAPIARILRDINTIAWSAPHADRTPVFFLDRFF